MVGSCAELHSGLCGLSARLSLHLLLSSQPSQGFFVHYYNLLFMVIMIGLAGSYLNIHVD